MSDRQRARRTTRAAGGWRSRPTRWSGYKESFGRGPTKAHARYAGPNIVICTLEDSMTPAERKLAAWNEHQRLRETRAFLQYATGRDLTAKV